MLQRINTEIGKKYIITINYTTPTTEYFYDPFMNVVGTLPSTRNLVDIEFLAVYNEYFLQTKGYSDPMTVNSVTLKEIPNLVSNGTFDVDSDWTKGANTIISGGKAIVNGSGILLTSTTTNQLMPPKRYRYYFELSNFTGSIAIWGSVGSGYFTTGGTKSGEFSFGHSGNSSIYFYANQQTTGYIDNLHIYEIPEWASNGNHIINWTTRDKYTNSGSLLISSSGTGNTSSNYVSLPYANFDTLESTKKYTLEFWSKVDPSTLTYGANLVTNGTDWTDSNADGIPDGWSKNIGTETFSFLTESGSVYLQIPRVHGYDGMSWGGLTTGRVYKVSYKVRGNAPYRTYFGSSNEIYHVASPSASSWETITDYGILTGVGVYITLNSATAGKYLEVDDVSIQQATLVPYITASLGSKSVNSAILNPNSWIKTVLNFEAGSTELSQDIKLNLNQSCSVYVDKLSLSQRYDLGFFAKFRMESSSKTLPTIFTYGGVGSITRGGYWLYRNASNNTIIFQLQSYDVASNDNTPAPVVSYGTLGNWVGINATIDLGTIKLFKNSISSYTGNMLSMGKFYNLTDGVGIGTFSAQYTTGSISQLQVVRFDNIALSNWNSASMDLQSVYNGGADEVLRLEFQNTNTASLFYRDTSPNKLTIVPNNVDMTNLVYINTGFNITSGSDKSQVVTDWDKELIVSQSLNTGSVYRLEFSYKGNGLVYVKNGNYTVASASANTSSFGYYEGTFLCTSPIVYMHASSGSWFEVDGLGLREIPNMISNGSFNSGTTGFSADAATISNVGNAAYVVATGNGAIFKTVSLSNPSTLIQNKRYRLNYEVLQSTGGWNTMRLHGYTALISSNNGYTGSNSIVFTYPDSLSQLRWICTSSLAGDTLWIDNIHLYEVPDWKSNGNHIIDQSTQYVYSGSFTGEITSTGTGSSSTNFVNLAYTEFDALAQNKKYILEFVARPSTSGLNLTIGIGANSKSFALTETSSWTSCIWNIDNYDNSFTNQDVKMWLNNSGSVWFDNLRLKQNYDLALVTAGKFSKNTAYSGSWDLLIFGSETTDSSSVGYGLSYDNGYGIWGDFVDNNSNILTVSSSVIPDKYYDSIILVKDSYRDMNTSSLYIENQLINRNYGTLGLMDIPYEESGSINPSHGFKGWLGRTQIIRFDNISVSNFNPTTYRIGDTITGGGAEVVAYYTWKDAVSESSYTLGSDQLFYDKSSIRNDLSAININVSNIKSVPFNLITGSLVISRSSFNEQLITGNGYTLEFKTYASGNNAIPMDVTASIGTTTYAWTGISYNSASPSKLSYNFVATTSSLNSDMIFQKSTSGVLNIYDISLTQTYDTTINVMLENNYDVVGRYLMYMEYDSGSFYIRKDANEYTFSLGDVTFAVPSSSFGTGSWASVSYVHKVGSGTEVFVNGNSVLYDSSSKYLSSLKSVEYFVVGNDNVTASYASAYSGKIGEIQMIRGYAYNSEDSLYLYENGFNYPRVGKIAFWYKWIEGNTEDIAGYNELTAYNDYSTNYGSYESVNNVKLRELFSQNYGIYYDYNDGYPYLYGNEYKFYTRNDVESYDGTSVIKVGRIFKIKWNSYY